MRHFVFALLIALLPLRGWMADAMSMEMAVQQLQQAQHTPDAKASMPADCPKQAGGAQAQTGSEPIPVSGGIPCHGCGSCELCLPMSLLALAALPLPLVMPQTAPPTAGERFASAERAPGFKPPIS